jgi:trigger factor
MSEILEKAVGDTSQQALAEKDIRPAIQPEIEIVSFEDGEDLEYIIKVECLPEIKPVDFSTINLERLIPIVDENEVQKALENMAESNKVSTLITKKRKTKSGDVVLIDFVGSINGEDFSGGKADNYELELGTNSFIPGFEDQLIGKNAKDKVEVKVNFPHDYNASELAGKEALFKVTVNEIREATKAKIDDDLAKKLGMENLEKLKETIKEEQGRELKDMSRARTKKLLLDSLSVYCDFEVPSKLIDSELDSIRAQYEEEKKSEKTVKSNNKDTSEFQPAEFAEIALRRVRLGLLLSEVGRLNNIQVSQDDVTRSIMQQAQQYQGQEQAIMDFYKNNPEAMQNITAPLYEEKVVDFILELANVKDKSVTIDQMMNVFKKDNEENIKEGKKSKKKITTKKASADKTVAKKKASVKKKG